MLVSAIETVAKDYIQMSKSAVEIFSEIEEGLSREILRCGGEELLIKVAERFVDKKYSGRKYRNFLLNSCLNHHLQDRFLICKLIGRISQTKQ